MRFLEDQGFEITYLNVDETGHVRLDELEDALRQDTILVSLMFVNNEIGTIQPVKEAGDIIKKKNPGNGIPCRRNPGIRENTGDAEEYED